MPRNYRPRPIQHRFCEHCQSDFLTNHARTRFCSDSCRVRAFYARQDHSEKTQPLVTATELVEAQLALSWTNVGIGALSSGAITLLNHYLHDSPAHQEVLRLLRSIEAGQAKLQFRKLSQDLDYLVAYVAAQVDSDITLGPRIKQAHQFRQAELKRLSSGS